MNDVKRHQGQPTLRVLSRIYYLASITLTIALFPLHGQNLVPNPSFEVLEDCPAGLSSSGYASYITGVDTVNDFIRLAEPWFCPTSGTSDLIATCATNSLVAVPNNTWGSSFASDGDNYVALIVYQNLAESWEDEILSVDYTEYVQVMLNMPMIPGAAYQMSFFYRWAENSKFATDQLGMGLSVGSMNEGTSVNPNPLAIVPQVVTPLGEVNTSTEWQFYQDTFVADQPYDHLTIGRFGDYADLTVEQMSTAVFPSTKRRAVYFIDEIEITLIEDCSIETEVLLKACENETLMLPDSTTVSENGTYIITLQTVENCDSTITYHVEFASHFNAHSSFTSCSEEGLIDPFGGLIQEDGLYSFTFQTIHGCDSTLIWDVTIDEPKISYADTVLCPNAVLPVPGGVISLPGIFEVVYPNANACDSTVIWTVTYSNDLTAGFTTFPASPMSIQDADVIEFFAQTNANSVFWSFGDAGSSVELNPRVNFFKTPGNYVVCLNVYDTFGCSNFHCDNLRIEDDCTLYIPNAITPNADGINDLFAVEAYGVDPAGYSMQIFNRNGHVIFETNDLSQSWDGSDPSKLYYAQNGLYVYQVYAKCIFGKETKRYVGSISVIR